MCGCRSKHQLHLTLQPCFSDFRDIVLTSVPVPQQVAVDVMDVGVDGWTTGDTARGHVGVILRVDVLKALPWHTWAELYGATKSIIKKKQEQQDWNKQQKPSCGLF